MVCLTAWKRIHMTDDLKIYNPRKFENLVKVFFNPSSVQFHQSQNTFIKVSEKVMNHCIWCMTFEINWPELVNQECNLGTSMWKWQTPAWWSDSLLLILHCMLFVVPYFHWTKDDELANASYIGICLIKCNLLLCKISVMFSARPVNT